MKKLSKNFLKLSPVVVAATFFAANSAFAGEVKEQVTSVSQLTEQSDNLGQVTSVSQFSDVQPTDWAFQALQSLVERYGCIAGYPNGTYRGNRALTRYEFAAGLNACLDRVNELIATATADLVRKEDLATLQRLQEEFSAELATLRGRVDTLEARTAELEANQFSTTTKLVGEAIFNLSDTFGSDEQAVPSGVDQDTADDVESNTIAANRVRLNLLTSFFGSDQLQTRLQARNITPYDEDVTGTNMTRLSFDGDNGNDIEIDKLNYAFNLGNAIAVKVDAFGAELYENINTFSPDLASSGRGAVSRYGRFSPIYRQGAGGAGATLTFNPKGPISLSAAYIADRANDPSDGSGLFDGGYAAVGQLSFQPSQVFNIGLTYAHTYQNQGDISLFDSTGSTYANDPFGGAALTANHYGVEAAFRLSPKITIGGWYGYSEAEAKSGAAEGDEAEFNYWAATLSFRDFVKQGNVLGFIFGKPPKASENDFVQTDGVRREDEDTSYHLEALYRLQLTDNIAVTPGVIVIFNPEHNSDNDTVYVGTLRTTFTF
ncbi:iron uptake porin [Mastigocladopsis repens]|uniref:iron uptake porin n=1 Tax=Mastigocladopsis repens TaxID=221287 RepID=UPI0002DAD6CE|nr:iron uptake porin [Mastigocladopsis repens]